MLRLPRRIIFALSVIGAAATVLQAAEPARVEAIRFWSFGDVTRIAVQTQGEYKLTSDQIDSPARVFFDLIGLRPPTATHKGIQRISVSDRRVKEIRVAEVSPGRTRIVFDLECPVEVVSSQLVNPDRLMIELRPKGTSLPALLVSRSVTASQRVDLTSEPAASDSNLPARLAANATPALNTPVSASQQSPSTQSPLKTYQSRSGFVVQQAYNAPAPQPVIATPPPSLPVVSQPQTTAAAIPQPALPPAPPAAHPMGVASAAKADASGDRSLVRVFGLKMGKVVIDPGHGGHDTGTIGPGGLMEKDLVLDVALRLGNLITQQLGAEVIYTRSDDTFIPLEERTKIANDQKADLFISVHANSSPESSATGVETYYFNFTSDKTSLDLATRENATSSSSISDLGDLLHRAVLQAKLEESRDFAQKVETSLGTMSAKMNSRSKDRGVRQAPFVVLIGATMPSILTEIGFVSNPHDERLMQRADQRQKIAESLFKGVSQYAATLSHVQLARANSH